MVAPAWESELSMNLLCPNCQKMLQVAEQYAGQLMKCPLCEGTFTVPTLPSSMAAHPIVASVGAGAAASEPAPGSASELYRLAPPEPAASSAETLSKPTPPLPPRERPAFHESAASSSPPIGPYAHVFRMTIKPEVLYWIPPAALGVVFILLFFPWIDVIQQTRESYTGWQTGFGDKYSALGLFYVLLFIVTLLLAAAAIGLPHLPADRLPASVLPLLPWRCAIVGFAAFLAFVFLALELVTSFGPERETSTTIFSYRTSWLRLAVFFHLLAVVSAGFELWLTMRRNQQPHPKIEIMW